MNGVRFTIPEGGRLICIADCHGDYVLLRRLIDRLAPGERDVLAILGDFNNKGWGNLACTGYLMHLQQTRPGTIVLAGNGEYRNIRMFLDGEKGWILNYLKKWPKKNIYLEWARQCGFETVDASNYDEAEQTIVEVFGDMMRWVRDLPLYAYDDRYLLVHSGMAELPADGEADPECLENGLYPENGINRTGRWMIAGHYPVANFDPGELLPYVNKEAQIVDIDGGINTLPLEQLNALICTPDGFSYTFEDHYEARVILSDYRPVPLDAPAFHQKWPDIYVDVIRPGESFSFCRSRMGREGYIKNEKLVRDDQGLRFTGCALAKLLPVRAGEVVKLLDDSADDYWCVRNTSGLMGYVPRSIVGEAVTPEGPFAEITPLNI